MGADHDISRRIDAVRRAWRRARALAGLATLAAEAIVLLLAIAVADRAYHLDAAWRGALLAGLVAALGVSAWARIARPLARRLGDDQVALHVEERVPELAGKLAASVEILRDPPADPLAAELASALAVECLERAARISPWSLVDRRRLARRAAAAGIALLALAAIVAAKPQLAAHECARLLMPWASVPLDEAEARAAKRKADVEARNRQLIAEQAASAPKPPTLIVEPGDARLRRGGSLRVRVSADRVTEPPVLRWRDSAGTWRKLPMPEDPDRPGAFAAALPDLTVDAAYAVEMGKVESREYAITVYDAAELKRATLTLHYPAYLGLPDATQPAGPIDAVEGTVARIDLQASGPLKSAETTISGAPRAVLTIAGAGASGELRVAASGQWSLAALDADGQPVAGIEGPWAVVARKDLPPTLELLYPSIDTIAHPMAEIAIAAKAEDDIGLREVRLISAYNEEAPTISRKPCAGSRSLLAEFRIDLESRAKEHKEGVRQGDSIVFRIETEDLKGQIATSDPYSVTVGQLETFAHYGGFPHTGAKHGPSPPEIITLIGAAQDLESKRGQVDDEKLKRECKRIADFLIDKNPKH